ncbi:uncharacterized protein LOC114858776 [Betta splendens]|uniref:Uncharacterized protein LOC114858776 n=1 Tax=Betta splendens TaxID=158456 RepID=A0A9W2XWX8_BETSP|nr:uncharacterized protein LOC114858776 [Betta splendens]XP_055366293.1 uncharacterized protein LOC114858776 [Betta splendens]
MKMLVALLLLGCSVAQGTILSKCEVWDQLLRVLDNNPRNMRFLASLFCQAEKSGFNTSSVIVRSSKLEALTRVRRTNSGSYTSRLVRASGSGVASLQVAPASLWSDLQSAIAAVASLLVSLQNAVAPPPPVAVALPPVAVAPPSVTTPVTPPSVTTPVAPPSVTTPVTPPSVAGPAARRVARSPNENEVQTCYGVFALCNTVACSDGKTQSLNLCGLDCSKLRDDDIRDDASCMWTLAKFGKMLVDESCTHPQASNYFTECSS